MNQAQRQLPGITVSRDYLFLVAGRMMPLLALLIITLLYSRWLSYEAYGIFQSVWMYANIVGVILGFGITTIIFSTNADALFSFISKNKKQLLKFYGLLWACTLIGFLFLSKNFTNNQRILIASFIIIQNLNTVVETVMIKNSGEKKYFILNCFYASLFLAWHIWMVETGYSLANLMIGILLLSVIKLAFLFWLKNNPGTSVENIAEELSFKNHWIFVGLYDIIGIIGKWVDKLILLYLLTSAEFAIFLSIPIIV